MLVSSQDARQQRSSLNREHHKTVWTWRDWKMGDRPGTEEDADRLAIKTR